MTYIHITEVSSKYSDWLEMICAPNACSLVMRGAHKVEPKGTVRENTHYNTHVYIHS